MRERWTRRSNNCPSTSQPCKKAAGSSAAKRRGTIGGRVWQSARTRTAAKKFFGGGTSVQFRQLIQGFPLWAALVIIIGCQSTAPPSQSGPRTYSVKAFGAKGDGTALDSPAIDK